MQPKIWIRRGKAISSLAPPLSLAVLFVAPVAFLFSQSTPKSDPGTVRSRISSIIQSTIKRSQFVTAEGTKATVMPLLPSNEEYSEVKKYGDISITALADYATSGSEWEQQVAMRLLGVFKNEHAFEAFQDYAKKSKFSFTRGLALRSLTGFPSEKVRPVLEQSAASDPAPEIRKLALDLLERISQQSKRPQ